MPRGTLKGNLKGTLKGTLHPRPSVEGVAHPAESADLSHARGGQTFLLEAKVNLFRFYGLGVGVQGVGLKDAFRV